MQEEEKARKERMKDYRRRYRAKHGIKEHPHRWKKVAGVVIAVCIAGFGSFFAAQNKAASMVTLDGQSIQGWTNDDLQQYLLDHKKQLKDQKIKITGKDIDETISLDAMHIDFDQERIADELYLIGRTGSPVHRVAEVITTLRFGKDVPLSIKVDDDALNDKITDIYNTYNQEAKDAYAEPNADNATVTLHKEKDRIVIDTDALRRQIDDQLHAGNPSSLEAPIQSREEAAVKKDDLKSIDTVLSYYTTHFDDSNKDRNDNILLAQKKLNHALVPAQKDFSFNKYVGARTHENGYKDAPVYFDNKLVSDAGGGVCQVSTTLFNAVLRAGLFIASRSPHFAPAAYVPVGMDATVADDSLDFAFTNPFQHPVYVYTAAGENSITTYILGNHADTCTVTFQTTKLQNLPHRVVHKHDDNAVTDKQEQEGYDGHDITIHRTVAYTDGDHYADDITSHYAPNTEIITTNGPASEDVVKTSDLEPQDTLINALHDMLQAVAAPSEDTDNADTAADDSADSGDGYDEDDE